MLVVYSAALVVGGLVADGVLQGRAEAMLVAFSPRRATRRCPALKVADET